MLRWARWNTRWSLVAMGVALTGCGVSGSPLDEPELMSSGTARTGSNERHVAMRVTADDPDPYQRLIARREALRIESAGAVDRAIRRLPPKPGLYFDRLRRVSGEAAVLRELIRWADDSANAEAMSDAQLEELRSWAIAWRDWERALADLAGGRIE